MYYDIYLHSIKCHDEKKTLDGFIDFNINFKITEHNTNEKLDLDQIKVVGSDTNKIK